MKKRAVFLDRDGVINKRAKDHDYIKNWDQFEFLPNVARTIRSLNKNFLVVVVSNQRGMSRGIMTMSDVLDINRKMQSALKKDKAAIDKIYICPHSLKDNCSCRKPKPGLLLAAARDLDIDLTKSYIVGDSMSDIEAGKKAGCKTIFLGTPENITVKSDFTVKNILEIPKILNSLN